MVRIALSFFFVFLSLHLEAQNIVNNGSFEEIFNCPNSPGQLSKADFWRSSSLSPDFYHFCGSNGYETPLNSAGNQVPLNGEGYLGLATYSEPIPGAREYAQNTLKYALTEDEMYYFEMHVSLADSFQYAVHNIGITFTNEAPLSSLECHPNCNSYLENTIANPLTSQTDWVKISGTFTAQGGEQYLHIGNFRKDEDSEIEFVGGGTSPDFVWNQSYYYIDDVWLSHIDSMGYVGVNEELGISNEQYLVYPNPSSGAVTVDYACSGNDKAELQVFDMSGRQVYRTNQVCGKAVVELDGLNNGLYHCRLVINGTAVLSEKLIILRE